MHVHKRVTARITGAARRLAARSGRRGAFLTFLAVLDTLFGWGLVTDPPPPVRLGGELVLSWQQWGLAWMGCGVLCATGVLASSDRFQFGIAILIKAGWGMMQADLWMFHHATRAWIAAVVWLCFAATVWMIAGWPEPVTVVTPPDPVVPEHRKRPPGKKPS